jgi:hypothetical protein
MTHPLCRSAASLKWPPPMARILWAGGSLPPDYNRNAPLIVIRFSDSINRMRVSKYIAFCLTSLVLGTNLWAQNVVISKQKILVIGSIDTKLYWISQLFTASGDPVPEYHSRAYLQEYNLETGQVSNFALRDEAKFYGTINPKWSEDSRLQPSPVPAAADGLLKTLLSQTVPLFADSSPYQSEYVTKTGLWIKIADQIYQVVADGPLINNLRPLFIATAPENLGLYVSEIYSYKTHHFVLIKNHYSTDRYNLELLLLAPATIPFPDKINTDTTRSNP